MDNLVIVMSHILLTPDQICSTLKEPKSGDLRCDLDNLHRRQRLHPYFKDEEDQFSQEGSNYDSLNLNINTGCHPLSIHPAHPLSR